MALKVDCPTCGRKTGFSPANPWRPFCSERCKTVDLGAWASEAYRVAGDPQEDVVGDDAAAPVSPAKPHS